MKISKGFTLIEVMITVAIIGVLAAIAVPMYQKHVEKTRITAAKATLVKHGQFMTRWKLEHGTFADGSNWPKSFSDDEFYSYSFKPNKPATTNTELFEILAKPKPNNSSTKVIFMDQDGSLKVCTSDAATSCE